MEVVVASTEDWADQVATAWAERLEANPRLRVCCPTGDTPAEVYRAIAGRVASGRATFATAEIFLLDEFLGLAPGHPASCEAMLQGSLLDHIDIPPGSVHLFEDHAADPDQSAARFEAGLGDRELDLAILGLGLNGHIGMNEPGSPIDSETRVVLLAESTRRTAVGYGAEGTPPTHGVTMGLRRLMDSREIWLLVSGSHKAEILARVLDGAESPEVPASLLRLHPALTVFADSDAAAQLSTV